jgi:hypothetical protein
MGYPADITGVGPIIPDSETGNEKSERDNVSESLVIFLTLGYRPNVLNLRS